MLYDVRLELHYEYEGWVHGDRHHVRVMPITIDRVQRVIAASLSFDPKPDHELTFLDFFSNSITSIAYRDYHDHLDVRLSARVSVEDIEKPADLSPTLDGLQAEIAGLLTLGPHSPHHFLSASPRVPLSRAITAYALESVARTNSVQAAALDYCRGNDDGHG